APRGRAPRPPDAHRRPGRRGARVPRGGPGARVRDRGVPVTLDPLERAMRSVGAIPTADLVVILQQLSRAFYAAGRTAPSAHRAGYQDRAARHHAWVRNTLGIHDERLDDQPSKGSP